MDNVFITVKRTLEIIASKRTLGPKGFTITKDAMTTERLKQLVQTIKPLRNYLEYLTKSHTLEERHSNTV